mgnify:CR=1 FL=1
MVLTDCYFFSSLRSIFPRSFFGSEVTNSIQRGYLYRAMRFFTKVLDVISEWRQFGQSSRAATMNALGFTRPSSSSCPTTAHSSTASCCKQTVFNFRRRDEDAAHFQHVVRATVIPVVARRIDVKLIAARAPITGKGRFRFSRAHSSNTTRLSRL